MLQRELRLRQCARNGRVMSSEKRGMLAINATLAYDTGSPTGLAVYTRELVARLVPEEERPRSVIYTNSKALRRRASVACIDVPKNVVPGRRLSSVKRTIWLATAFPAVLHNSAVDLVYCTVPEGSVVHDSRVKQVITIHDLLPLRYPRYYPRQHYYFRYILPMVIRQSDAIICDSLATKESVLREFGAPRAPLVVVPAGYNSDLFHPGLRSACEPAYFMFVGDMRPYKNVERVLRAFSDMTEKNVQFVVVGDAHRGQAHSLEDWVNRLGLQERVRFTGFISDEEVAEFYRSALALVFPSLWEGFGLPPLEAMASGCPVITSNVASLPEVCGDAAEYVDPTSVDSIRGAMERIIREPALREDLRGRGLDRSKLFSWDRTAHEVWQVLESVRQ